MLRFNKTKSVKCDAEQVIDCSAETATFVKSYVMRPRQVRRG